MRALGTLLVILAHVNPPVLISQLRTFDVTLLVFISGMSLTYSQFDDYYHYLKKRCQKLLIPAYITIIIILTTLLIGSNFLHYNISLTYIRNSLLLIDKNSIGFVWIVKVYLLLAFSVPVIKLFEKKFNNSYFLYFLLWLIIYFFSICSSYFNVFFYQEYFMYLVQFFCVAVMGLHFYKVPKDRCLCLLYSTIVFSIFQFSINEFVPSNYKFPPHIYWLSYGVVCSCLLWFFVNPLLHIIPDIIIRTGCWISKCSYDIYIFHIYFMWTIFLIGRFVSLNWLIKYLLVVSGAILTTRAFQILKFRFQKGHD